MDIDTIGEYRLKVSIRNNLILSKIEELGFTSVAAFCRLYGLSDVQINSLICMRQTPLNVDGEFRPSAKALMEALGCAPADIWTDAQLTLKMAKNSVDRVVSQDVINQYLADDHATRMLLEDPSDVLERKQEAENVQKTIDGFLAARNAKVLSMRLGIGCDPQTLEEIGNKIGVQKERVRQIEWKALRILSQPLIKEHIRGATTIAECKRKMFDQRKETEKLRAQSDLAEREEKEHRRWAAQFGPLS
mgnify:CR=1 FL=1